MRELDRLFKEFVLERCKIWHQKAILRSSKAIFVNYVLSQRSVRVNQINWFSSALVLLHLLVQCINNRLNNWLKSSN